MGKREKERERERERERRERQGEKVVMKLKEAFNNSNFWRHSTIDIEQLFKGGIKKLRLSYVLVS